MSHVAACKLNITDLDALKAAADRLGFEFRENQKTHEWYGEIVPGLNDEKEDGPNARDPATFGKCVHALRPKEFCTNDYEIGIVKNEDGSYGLVYDSFGSPEDGIGGGVKLEEMAGKGLCKLKAEYGAAVAEKDMKRRLTGYGYYVQTTRDARGFPKVRAVKQ